MYFNDMMSKLVAVCVCVTPMAAAGQAKSQSALGQAKVVEKSSKDAAKDANAGKLGEAKGKAGQGFDSTAASTTTVHAQPVKQDDSKEVARRENEAQKEREKEKARQIKLDDPKRAPPKPK